MTGGKYWGNRKRGGYSSERGDRKTGRQEEIQGVMEYSKIKRQQENIVELEDRQIEDRSRYWETGREEWTFGTERQED
jgi:hypothetical protein